MSRVLCACVMLAMLLGPGCGDDAVNPETFALTLEVVDPRGMPVFPNPFN